jgi:hypothetical protein
MSRHVSNAALRLARVPPPDASIFEIWKFAHIFDGYTHCGSFEAVAEIANRRSPKTLTEYRICLFFEQRRWRHFGQTPEDEDESYIRWLVEGIRAHLRNGTLE